MRLLWSSLLACAALVGGLTPAAATPQCSETDLPVSVPAPGAVVHGQLCGPAGSAPTMVQLLVHGGTYNRSYWDFPYQPQRYSYQRDMAQHGYATFAVDLLGSGRSTTPLSATLSGGVEARSIHEIVDHLRAGRVGGQRFERVVLVGHSIGSGAATLEAASYHDVDAVILTGTTHLLSVPVVATGLVFDAEPVTLDARLRRRGDPGYVTTQPGARARSFYNTSDADPRVIASDDATKDQVSIVNYASVLTLGNESLASRSITVPVLLVVGEKDNIFCGFLARDCSTAETLHQAESPFYSPAAVLSTFVLPGSGHVVALHENAGEYREATRAWLRDHVS